MAYASADDLLARYDARRLADLCRDDGVKASAADAPTVVTGSAVVPALLDSASGLVSAACLVGKRYSRESLAALTGDALALLKQLTCDLAFGLLVARRGHGAAEAGQLAPRYAEAQRTLELLRGGHRIFGLADESDAEAGLARFPDAAWPQHGNLVSSAGRLFGPLGCDPYNPRPRGC